MTWGRPHHELRNEPPVDMLERTIKNLVMVTISPELLQRMAIQDIGIFIS